MSFTNRSIECLADAQEIVKTSIHSDEISEAVDYIADHEGPQDERKTSYKVGYLIASIAYSNMKDAAGSDRAKPYRTAVPARPSRWTRRYCQSAVS